MTQGHPGGHGLDGLYLAGETPVHRVAPEVKIAATVAFVFAVVATPREALWALGGDAVLLAGVVALAGLSPALVARRLRIEVPFLLFAVFMPFAGAGPARRRARRVPVRAGAVGGVEHRGQGHARRRGVDRSGRHHPGRRPAQRARSPARPPGDHGHRRVHGPLSRDRGRRGPAHARRPPVPRLRPPLAVAGAGDGGVGRNALRPLVRAGRTGLPGHAGPWLRRHHAGPRRADGRPPPAGGRRSCRSRRGRSRPRRWWWHDRSGRGAGGVGAGRGLRLPRRPDGARRRRPGGGARRAGGGPRAQRRRKVDAGAAPQRHPRGAAGRGDRRRPTGGEAQPGRGPPPRGHRLPGPRRPAVHAHGPRRRGVRAGPGRARWTPTSPAGWRVRWRRSA